MIYRDAIDRALALRVRAKSELDPLRKTALLSLAENWEAFAAHCQERSRSGKALDGLSPPPADI